MIPGIFLNRFNCCPRLIKLKTLSSLLTETQLEISSVFDRKFAEFVSAKTARPIDLPANVHLMAGLLMDQINRVVRQRQNAEQKRQKKEKAERAARAIEEYEKQLKMERKIEVINEKIKKEKSKGLFMDTVIAAKDKQLKTSANELAQIQRKVEADSKEKDELVVKNIQLEAEKSQLEAKNSELEFEKKKNKADFVKAQAELDQMRKQKEEAEEKNTVLKDTVKELINQGTISGAVYDDQHAQRSETVLGLVHVPPPALTDSASSSPSNEQNEEAGDELAKLAPNSEETKKIDQQITLEQELAMVEEAEKLKAKGQQQQPVDTDEDNAVEYEEVKGKEIGRQKCGDETVDNEKLPALADSDNDPAKSNEKQKPCQKKEEQAKGAMQQHTDEGEEEAEKSKDKMPAPIDSGIPPKNKHTDNGEKEAEEKKENLPTSADSGNPLKCSEEKQKQKQMDEGEEKEAEEESDGYKGDCEQQGEQMKKTEEKQVEEESEGKMSSSTDEHTHHCRREENDGQQAIVMLSSQIVAQPAAAGPSEEKSKGCFCLHCVKKTKKEQQKKSPPYSATGNK
ncbi:hypothetical protein niasHT_037347 [Heterodera trifolii]|uniref:Uncharacterized protein n=1 Tax=Heterodera trifolii TaxID=157864 RepID=A0ABD2J239_9BILA